MTMPLIVWDIDDVLNNLMFEWFKDFSQKHQVALAYNQLSKNPPADLLGISLDSYLESLDDFREREMLKLAPAKELLEWFETYGSSYRHIALTAVPFKYASWSSQWLFKHYGNWIRGYYFVPSARKTDNIIGYDKTKGEVLKKLGKVDFFIDDNETNIAQAEALGIKTIVFPRPWNKQKDVLAAESLKMIK